MFKAHSLIRTTSTKFKIIFSLSNNIVQLFKPTVLTHRCISIHRCFSAIPTHANASYPFTEKFMTITPKSINFTQIKFIHQIVFRLLQISQAGESLNQLSMQTMIPTATKWKIMMGIHAKVLEHTICGFGYRDSTDDSAVQAYYAHMNALMQRLESSQTLYNEYRHQLEELKKLSLDIWFLMIRKTFNIEFKPMDLYEVREAFVSYFERVKDQGNQTILMNRLLASKGSNEARQPEVLQHWLDELMNEEIQSRNYKGEEGWVQFNGAVTLYAADEQMMSHLISIQQISLQLLHKSQYSNEIPMSLPSQDSSPKLN